MIKVLIVGLGSIGQRHAKALLAIGIKNIAALRTNKGQKELDSLLHGIVFFEEEVDAFNWNPTHIIISNPTSLHLYFVELAIDRGIKFFVEKPITNELKDFVDVNKIDNVNGVVGYNLRFHGLFMFIKKLIDNQIYGNIVTAKLHVGQYLPNWHPYEDYRKAYYARKDLGGGGLRTLSHEIDLMQFFFGKVNSVFAKVQTNSGLEIDVDDVTNIIASTDLCSQVYVHINLLDPNVKREGVIYFTDGVIKYDIISSEVLFTANNGEEKIVYSKKEDVDLQYQSQMKEFISNESTKYACSYTQGISVMQIIDKCEESNDKKQEICLV